MRILFVGRLPWEEIGGAPSYAHLLAEGLSRRGHEVTFLYPARGGNPPPSQSYRAVGARARSIGPGRYARAAAQGLALRWKASAAVREHAPDLVHLHYANVVDLALVSVLARSGKPLVVTAHCGPASKHLRIAPAWAARRLAPARLLLCPARSQADHFLGAGFPAHRLRLAPFAVPEAFLSSPRQGSENERPRCLFLGRIVPEKGIGTLLAALARLPSERRPLLDLMGPCPGSYRARLEKEIRRTGLRDRVRLRAPAGGEAERIAALDACDVFVHPSRADIGPLSVIEAMARGRAVAASALPGTAEILDGTGALFPPDDAERLAETLDGLLADAPERARLGERARLRAAAFSPRALVEAHLGFYSEVTEGGT